MTDEESLSLRKAVDALEDSVVLRDKERYNGAVSRAYYAMFHAASAALLSIPGESYKRHATVHNMFLQHWVGAGKIEHDYHRYLTIAFDARNKADYFGRKFSTKEEADLHILHAEAFIRRVRELLQDSVSL